MRAALALISVVTAGCSLLFEVEDVAPPDARREEPAAVVARTEIAADAGVDQVDAARSEEPAVASTPDAPCPPPLIQRRLGIECP